MRACVLRHIRTTKAWQIIFDCSLPRLYITMFTICIEPCIYMGYDTLHNTRYTLYVRHMMSGLFLLLFLFLFLTSYFLFLFSLAETTACYNVYMDITYTSDIID